MGQLEGGKGSNMIIPQNLNMFIELLESITFGLLNLEKILLLEVHTYTFGSMPIYHYIIVTVNLDLD